MFGLESERERERKREGERERERREGEKGLKLPVAWDYANHI